jgi:hypothetical protein
VGLAATPVYFDMIIGRTWGMDCVNAAYVPSFNIRGVLLVSNIVHAAVSVNECRSRGGGPIAIAAIGVSNTDFPCAAAAASAVATVATVAAAATAVVVVVATVATTAAATAAAIAFLSFFLSFVRTA